MGVKNSGLDILRNELEKLAEAVGGDLPEKMLDAGADAAVDEWKAGIVRHRHVDTGEMLNSVGVAPGTRKGRKREIYPLGSDRKGVRNAEKAYVLNYGRGKGKRNRRSKKSVVGLKGDRFVDDIQKKTELSTYKAMSKVFDEESNKITK